MAAFKAPDSAYLVLMDISREVVWRVSGPVTNKKLQALADALNSPASGKTPKALRPTTRDARK